jgi:TRAP-type C4-dicarboxylate transport system permease small subunit
LRRFLDRLYVATAALAAACLAGIAVVMLAQAAMRELGLLLRGADDIVAWLCAASAFLALPHTFRSGELVRVSLVLTQFGAKARRHAETACLFGALIVVGYATWAVAKFAYESWQFNELAQGLIQIPIWIPQMSLVIGCAVFLVAVLDELVTHLRGGKICATRRPTSAIACDRHARHRGHPHHAALRAAGGRSVDRDGDERGGLRRAAVLHHLAARGQSVPVVLGLERFVDDRGAAPLRVDG